MPIWQFIIIAVVFFSVLLIGTACLANLVMTWAGSRYSEKRRNEYQQALEKLLPGKNCGACGYGSCKEYAAEIFYGRADKDKCPHGSEALPGQLQQVVDDFMKLLESEPPLEKLKEAEMDHLMGS